MKISEEEVMHKIEVAKETYLSQIDIADLYNNPNNIKEKLKSYVTFAATDYNGENIIF